VTFQFDGAGPERVADERGSLLAAVSDRLVRLYKELYGKGPTKAKTFYQGDLLVVVMRGGFTQVERTLQEAGRAHAVVQQRMEFQEAVRDRFTEAVTELTGREVVAFMSGTHQDPDITAEIFLLAPEPATDGGVPQGQ
jgi:uncharacterized protein YbcI